jgi:hypothetical protein
LMLRQGIDDSAPEDMAEQLVTGLGERERLSGATGFLLVHAPSLMETEYQVSVVKITLCTNWCKRLLAGAELAIPTS